MLEAVVCTLLMEQQTGAFDDTEIESQDSHKHLLYQDLYNRPQLLDQSKSSDVKTDDQKKPLNSVYVYNFETLAPFYDIVVQGEPLHCGRFIGEWYGKANGPLHGLELPKHTLDMLFKHETLAKCILMSDIFSRSAVKFSKSFPMAYS